MQRVLTLLAVGALTAVASAQFSVVLPNGYGTQVENSANLFPFGHAITPTYPGLRIQHVYDSSNFTGQLVTYPIVITGLRFRAQDLPTTTSWAGGTYNPATIQMSTAAVDYLATTTTWATNHGPDLTTVHSGPVVVQPGAGNGTNVPGPWFVDVQFPASTFTYDPNLGDLVIDCDVAAGSWGGGGSTSLASVSAAGIPTPLARRVYSSTLYPNANAVDQNILVCEVQFRPAAGLHAIFTSNVRGGASPLTVNFTDLSVTDDPNGITTRLWDLDGDNVIDSSLPNPTFQYTACGSYNVTLTVMDATHAPSSITRMNYIVTDVVTPSFTTSTIPGPAGVVQFTDTSTPTPTGWAWDLDGDSVVDSTAQNPVWPYGATCAGANVTLTVSRLCQGPWSTTRFVSAGGVAASTVAGGNGNTSTTYVGNMFNIDVTNPQGINICAMSVTPYSFAGQFDMSVYVTPGSYVGNNLNAAAWRLIGTGTGLSTAGPFASPTVVYVPFSNGFAWLPQGQYGVAVYLNRTPLAATYIAYSNAPVGPFANGDVTIHPSPATAPGIATLGLFSGGVTASRAWNGRIHYSTITTGTEAGFGFFAPGCAGSLPVSTLVHTSRPSIGGTLALTLDNLPLSMAILMVGFSRTASAFGPLPVSLVPFNAGPTCFGRVSPDVTLFLLGGGGTANYGFTIPNAAGLISTQLFYQAFVPDPGFNGLGAVVGDAGAAIIGS